MQALRSAHASLEPATWQTMATRARRPGADAFRSELDHQVQSAGTSPKQHQPQEPGTLARRAPLDLASRDSMHSPAGGVDLGEWLTLRADHGRSADLEDYAFTPTAIEALDWLQGIGMLLALTWLLTRIGGTIDQALALRLPSRADHESSAILVPFAGRAVRMGLAADRDHARCARARRFAADRKHRAPCHQHDGDRHSGVPRPAIDSGRQIAGPAGDRSYPSATIVALARSTRR